MLDPSGANTTAAAAVIVAGRHADFSKSSAVVLGGTGAVGRRVVKLLAGEGCEVGVVSRSMDRALAVCETVAADLVSARLTPLAAGGDAFGPPGGELLDRLATADVIVAAGAAGTRLLSTAGVKVCRRAKVFVDLNAVPPEGIECILATDSGRALMAELPSAEPPAVAYGALGVGGIKMKIHREAVRHIFASNTASLDADEMLAIGREIS
jgi:NAD(P)-dependent dehydrogenase (short-subunit alcohol dehydrogenase family)